VPWNGDAYHHERIAQPLRGGGEGSVLRSWDRAQQPADPRKEFGGHDVEVGGVTGGERR
jgi:hypothetical protein